ncbi:hypothetical protein GAYE_SCF23G4283 [Galdieria yellowstonensis]|uniref:Uncharacterized protein n=1 Tax=Galdieria yellowstonensis TaxID=3028027 RepID=A0AAV9IGC1_9RHOD|nr:hypothetical protein GAYE_SCF23G4283 [Galdieria yellowstonensis]
MSSLSFSLQLLANEPSRSWLLCRKEPVVPSSSFQNAAKVRHSMIYGTKRRILDLLVRPVGVINGILIGYSVGNYHAVFSKQFFPIDAPHCRRFALNLTSGEFMEVHWYLEASQCLIYWMHMSNSSERSRHFVLYELPPPGKLPTKLLKCVELFIQRDYSAYNSKTDKQELNENDDKEKLAEERETPFAFTGLKDALKRVVGTFRGTGRRTTYDPVYRNVTEDVTFPYSQISYFLQEASDGIDLDGHGVVEPPLFSLTIPVVSTSEVKGIIEELLRQEDLHLQAAEGDTSSNSLRERLSRERRWRQRLYRNFKRRRTATSNSIDDSLVIPIAAHQAAFHLGLSISGPFFSENESLWSASLSDDELEQRIRSMQTLYSGLWMFTCAGETIFIPSTKQIKRLSEATGFPEHNHKRKVSRTANPSSETSAPNNHRTSTMSSSLSGASEESSSQRGTASNGEEQESRSALLEKIKQLEYQNALLVQRVQQLERSYQESKMRSSFSPFKSPDMERRDTCKMASQVDYHDELNRILMNMDAEVQNQWELIGSNVHEHDFFF